MRTRSAVTIVELLVVAVLAIPLLAVAWHALIGARRSADVMATAAAIRSAAALERWLRHDLSSLDCSLGAGACTTAPGRLELAVALPGPGAGRPLLTRATVVYTLDPTTHAVLRDGRRLQGILAQRFEAAVVATDVDAFLQVDLVAIDPSKSGGRAPATHGTTVLAPLPVSFNADFLVDYTKWPPR